VDVYWDDWEMCFRFETLYVGKLPKMAGRVATPDRRIKSRSTVSTRE